MSRPRTEQEIRRREERAHLEEAGINPYPLPAA